MYKAMQRVLVFGALALGLSACASGNTLSETAPMVPAVQKDEARLAFYRTQIVGAAVQPKISVNGAETDTCQPNKVFFVDVPPGSNRITAATENKESLTVTVGAGQTAYIECTITFGVLIGRVDLKVVPRETGMGEVGNLAFSGLYSAKRGSASAANLAPTGTEVIPEIVAPKDAVRPLTREEWLYLNRYRSGRKLIRNRQLEVGSMVDPEWFAGIGPGI